MGYFVYKAPTHCAIIISKLINNGVFKIICLAGQFTMCNIFSIKIFNGGISMVVFTWSSNIWYAMLANISKKMVS